MRHFKDPYIRSIALTGFAGSVGADGETTLHLMDCVELPREAMGNPDTTISFRCFASLYELAAKRFGIDDFGLREAESLAPDYPNIGPIVFLSKFSRTLEQWLQLAMKYWIHHTNGFTLELIPGRTAGFTSLRYVAVPGFYPSRQLIENAMASICILCRNATGLQDRNPGVVRFRHRRPADISRHEKIFRCNIELDALYDEFLVENEVLDLPTKGSLLYFRGLVDGYMKARGALLPKVERRIETSVALIVASVIGTRKCNVDEVAGLLGVSTKKMQRLLADEDTSFSDILDRSRENIAMQLLSQSEMPVANIAGLLDYSSPSSFILAFRRWTGTTPLAYRKVAANRETAGSPGER